MKKIKNAYILISVILAVSIVIVMLTSFSQTVKSNADSKVKAENLIAELKDKEISLYYDHKADSDMLKGFYLKTGDNVTYFDWESIDKSGFYPKISLIQDKYIAIICTLGEGSGLDKQQLHIINKDSLEEMIFQNPLEILHDYVTTKIEESNVYIKINNNEWKTLYPNVKNNFFETVSYENMINYYVEDNSFKVTLKAQVSPSLFIGEFIINYIMTDEKEEFIPSSINFNFEDIEIS